MQGVEYNILEEAGSSLGFKHREETIEFFKNERKVSAETRKNLSLAATGRVLTPLSSYACYAGSRRGEERGRRRRRRG
jgi:hypothetical protein